ncbi:RTX toxin [Rhodoglobus sp.]
MRDTRGISAIVALALVVGSGLAVVSVSSAAEAHTPSISVTCEGVTVTGKYYEASGSREGQQNLIKFQLEGGKEQVIPFSKNGEHFFAFPNSTDAHTFTASVTAWNDPTNTSWNRTWTKTSTPCVSQSIVNVTASSCDVPGGTTGITATFKGLVADRKYELTLSGGAAGTQTVMYTPTQTTGSYTWQGMVAGGTYEVKITDTTNRALTACKTVQSLACPETSGIAIVPNECSVPGEGASIKVNLSGLVIGREYRVSIVNAGSDAVVDSHTFVANSATGAYNSPATPSASYYATVVDTGAAKAVPLKSATHTFLPCPELLVKPTLMATQCNVVSGDAEGEITVAVEGLVPGRSYTVVITDPANKPVLTNSNFVATTDRFDAELKNLAEGTYTATVTDVMLPNNTASASATLLPCATNDTTVELTAEQCTAPGGTAALTATVSNFSVGRDYTVTLMRDNVAVGAAQKLDSRTADAQKFTFDGLAPEKSYRVVVTDTLSDPTVTAAADMYLAACPGNPIVMISQTECNVLGASTIAVSASELVVGQNYTVTVINKVTGKAVEGIAPITFEADLPTLSLNITDVPNGETYTVSIVNADKTLSAEGDITLELCDLPTFPLPPEEPPTTVPPTVDLPTLDLPTLAFTGSSTIAPTLAGLGFLQLGLVLVGFSVARRRSVVREG